MKTIKLKNKLSDFIGIIVFCGAFLTFPVFSQETQSAPSPTPSETERRLNEIIKNLQKQKEIAELERDIAKAKKDSLDAEPKPNSTPLKSDVIVSGDEVEPDMVVFAEMEKATTKIGNLLINSLPNGATLVVFNENDFDDWKFYRESFPLFKVIIEDLTSSFCLLAQKSPDKSAGDKLNALDISSALVRGGNLLGQFADVLSYLRTDTKISGKEIKIGEESLVADLFGKLREKKNFKLFYPKIFAPEFPVFCGTKEVKISCCAEQNNSLCLESREIYCSETANLFDALYRARRLALQMNPDLPELKKINKNFEDFNDLFTEKSAAGTRSALEKYLNAERTNRLLQNQNVYLLEIESIKAVGKQRIRKNLFFLSDKLDYSGGIIVRWTLFDKEAQIVNSGVVTSYEGFKSPKKLKRETSELNRPVVP